jgi:hypothetical protein
VDVRSTDRPADAGSRQRCALGVVQATGGLLGLLIFAFGHRQAMFLVNGIVFSALGAVQLAPTVAGRRRGAQ